VKTYAFKTAQFNHRPTLAFIYYVTGRYSTWCALP